MVEKAEPESEPAPEPRRYRRKEFISFLQETVKNFEHPQVKLEQYMTPYDVAADFFALLNVCPLA